MPSQPSFEAGHRLLVAAGTAHFKNLVDSDLQQVQGELERVSAAFAALGYEPHPIVKDPDHNQLRQQLSNIKKNCSDGDLVVAYYTGHGARDNERFYLLTHDSDLADLDDTALPAEDLARSLIKGSKAAQVLVILDACYAGAGAADFAQVASNLTTALGGGGPGIFVVAAARTKQEAEQGALSAALAEVLANRDNRLGGRAQPFLAMDDVMGAIDDYLHEKHPAQVATWSSINVQGRCRLFPNPHHRTEIRPGLDLESQRAFAEHWVSKARGAELGVGGWYFTGREQALGELSAWLRQASSGGQPWVVTGGAGCGKSAVLARIVTLSNPTYRKEVLASSGPTPLDPETLAPEGVVNVAVHLRRKLLADVVAQIGGGLNIQAREPAELVDALGLRSDKTVIVVDALDEADDNEQIVSRLLHPLAKLPQVFLLVGTRPDSPEPGRRFRALGESVVEIDLDAVRYIGTDDVTRYVERRLLATEEPGRATPYRESPDIARLVAREVAAKANNIFLVAHTAVLALLAKPSIVDLSEPGWMDRLPTGLEGAFALFLDAIDARKPEGLSSKMVRSALLPLAFSQGEGLPGARLWAALGSALAGMSVSDADIALVRNHAAAFIVEALESDRSVYRLYHERIAEYLRSGVDEWETENRLVDALLHATPRRADGGGADWAAAHPYVSIHLAAHAARAGRLDELVREPTYLIYAEPRRLLREIESVRVEEASELARCYQLASHHLGRADPAARLAWLELAACQLGEPCALRLLADIRMVRPWQPLWANWARPATHRVLVQEMGSIAGITCLQYRGKSLLIAASQFLEIEDEGQYRWSRVLAYDLEEGDFLWAPVKLQHLTVTSIVVDQSPSEPLIVASTSDISSQAFLHVIRLTDGSPSLEPVRIIGADADDARIDALAVASSVDGHILAAMAIGSRSGSRLELWDLVERKSIWTTPSTVAEQRFACLATVKHDGEWVLICGASDGELSLRDLRRGDRLAAAQADGPVSKLDAVSKGSRIQIVAACCTEGIQVWEASQGKIQLAHEPRAGHADGVLALKHCEVRGEQAFVSCGRDNVARVWRLADSSMICDVMLGFGAQPTAVALVPVLRKERLVSADSRGVISSWNLPTTQVEALVPTEAWVGCVEQMATCSLGGRTVLVSRSNQGDISILEASDGRECKGVFAVSTRPCLAMSVGTVGGDSAIVTMDSRDVVTVSPAGGPLRRLTMFESGSDPRRLALANWGGRDFLIVDRGDGSIWVHDLLEGSTVARIQDVFYSYYRGGGLCVGYAKNGPVLVSYCEGRPFSFWTLPSGDCRGRGWFKKAGVTTAAACGQVGGRPYAAMVDEVGYLRLWDLEEGSAGLWHTDLGQNEWTGALALGDVDGKAFVASGHREGRIRVWLDGREIAHFEADCTVTSLSHIPPMDLAIGAREGVMVIRLRK